jgi:hypothetical protein
MTPLATHDGIGAKLTLEVTDIGDFDMKPI